MSLGTLLVLVGLILAVISLAGGRTGWFGSYILPTAVALIALGILVGAGPLVD
jgi:hypothetical protein